MNIKVNNYSKVLKKREILKDINLEFETGNIYLLSGINGSGKTMLLRAISGLIRPTEGNITVDGEILPDNQFLKNVGLVIGHTELPHEYTGLQNMKIINDINSSDTEEQLIEYLDLMNIKNVMNDKVSKYSMGMTQKLSIAQAFIGNPEILLLDEPLNALDKKSILKFVAYLDSIKKDKIIIIAAHNSPQINEIIDQEIEMEEGEVVEITKR